MTATAAAFVRTSASVEGAAISLMRGGSGSPLLFLHGSDAFGDWLPFMDGLARRFDTIVPDHPGFGRSDVPPWLDRIDDAVHAYAVLLESLDLHDVVIAGHGLGGWIACELALRDPARFRALVLVDAAGLPLRTDGIDAFMCSPDEFRRACYVDERRAPELDADALAFRAKDALMTARLAWQPRFYDPQLAKWLHRLRVPTLVVWGERDAIFPADQAGVFAHTIPDARAVLIPDAGHLPHIERPAAFLAAVDAFLDGDRP